jgi:hypothetical protein
MKHTLKNVLSLTLFLGTIVFALSSCYGSYEGRYYHHYHHHHREWYESHHQAPPPCVNWNVDVDVR